MPEAKNYAAYSFWLESCGDDLTPRPALDGSVDVDIAILGAGYSGLWTAYYLLKRDPSLKVAIAEKEIAGFGASGRNGGWCSAGFPLGLGELGRRYGHDAARDLQLAMIDAVDEVGLVAEEEGIDADYEKGGALRFARGKHQVPLIERSVQTYRAFGLEEHYQLLNAEEARGRVNVQGSLGAIFTPHCATIHPGKLARGLARVVERLGGTIYEQTPVPSYSEGSSPALHTLSGDIRAKTIVLAGESYLSQLKQLNRQLIPIYSLIVLTRPLTEEQWAEIGWKGRECVSSNRLTVDYLSRTTDGRILFGGRGAPYHFGSSISDDYDRHGPSHRLLRDAAMEWFPSLSQSDFSHAWGGPLGIPRDWMPTMSYNPDTGVATACGYTGQGVSTTNLAGRVLADLITGVESPHTRLPPVGHRSPNWEPEPLRYLGVRYVQRSYAQQDEKAAASGKPPNGTSLAERLSRH
ncbi:MAG TPA: FAD-binding oxidoreductase [Chloroflexota bacterium]|nr:FAD-binding oxidoreductase [Chloroflexota bacterium]